MKRPEALVRETSVDEPKCPRVTGLSEDIQYETRWLAVEERFVFADDRRVLACDRREEVDLQGPPALVEQPGIARGASPRAPLLRGLA
jgi:hypothetical protein